MYNIVFRVLSPFMKPTEVVTLRQWIHRDIHLHPFSLTVSSSPSMLRAGKEEWAEQERRKEWWASTSPMLLPTSPSHFFALFLLFSFPVQGGGVEITTSLDQQVYHLPYYLQHWEVFGKPWLYIYRTLTFNGHVDILDCAVCKNDLHPPHTYTSKNLSSEFQMEVKKRTEIHLWLQYSDFSTVLMSTKVSGALMAKHNILESRLI